MTAKRPPPVEEDVRVRQLRSLGYLHMLAHCPEDTPFTLPELQKRSQQEASKRRGGGGHTPSPSAHRHSDRQQHHNHKQCQHQHGVDASNQLPSPRRRRHDREDDKERRSPTKADQDASVGGAKDSSLAFLEVDVRVSQAKAIARLTHTAPVPRARSVSSL